MLETRAAAACCKGAPPIGPDGLAERTYPCRPLAIARSAKAAVILGLAGSLYPLGDILRATWSCSGGAQPRRWRQTGTSPAACGAAPRAEPSLRLAQRQRRVASCPDKPNRRTESLRPSRA